MGYKPVVSAGTTLDGITTLVWGTGGAMQTPLPPSNGQPGGFAGEGYYIVEDVNQAEDVDVKHGTNGTGIKSWRMLLKHGGRWNVTVQDDTTMTPPRVGTFVGLIDYIGDKTVAYTGKVVQGEYRAAKEVAGTRVITVENLTLVDSQTTF